MKQRRFKAKPMRNRENISIAILKKLIVRQHPNYFVFWGHQ